MTAAPALEERWRAVWPEALASWSAYTALREPIFFESDKDAGREHMSGQIAAIRLTDQTVMVNLETVRARMLEDFALPEDESAAIDARARAYLHANCSHCHRPGGGGGPSGLSFVAWDDDPAVYGVRKIPAAAGAGSPC